MQQLNYLFV